MHIFDAESQVLRDVQDESDTLSVKQHRDFKVITARHPTLGKIVIVEARDGDGVIVETER